MPIARWKSECRFELQLPHENEVFLKFVLLANILGFKSVAIGLELPLSIAEPWCTFFANYAVDWREKFLDRHPKHHGPRVAYGKRTEGPGQPSHAYYWTPADFRREAELNNIEADWTDVIQGPGGAIATVCLAGRTIAHSPELAEKTRVLVDIAVAAMMDILIEKQIPQFSIKLSTTEREYLAWVLDGKTSGEITDIMKISKGAADNMQRKLPERFQRNGIFVTAFLAYRLGMLSV
jgi:hypothetical protein